VNSAPPSMHVYVVPPWVMSMRKSAARWWKKPPKAMDVGLQPDATTSSGTSIMKLVVDASVIASPTPLGFETELR